MITKEAIIHSRTRIVDNRIGKEFRLGIMITKDAVDPAAIIDHYCANLAVGLKKIWNQDAESYACYDEKIYADDMGCSATLTDKKHICIDLPKESA